MQKNLKPVNALLLFLLIALQFACTSKNVEYGEATKALIKMVESDTALKSMLIYSIEKAKGNKSGQEYKSCTNSG
jgi:hypothetical protein